MIHICTICRSERDCKCGDCGVNKFETCTKCNNDVIIPHAENLGIRLCDLAQDPLGGYHFKPGQQEAKIFWDSVMN